MVDQEIVIDNKSRQQIPIILNHNIMILHRAYHSLGVITVAFGCEC